MEFALPRERFISAGIASIAGAGLAADAYPAAGRTSRFRPAPAAPAIPIAV